MIEIPPSVVASWPTPDYAHPRTRGPALPIVVLLLYAIAIFTFSLRLFWKIQISRNLCADDILIGLAIIPTTGVTVVVLLSKWRYLLDRHSWDLPPNNFSPANILATVNFVLFCLASTLVRISFLAVYRRLIRHRESLPYTCLIYLTIFVAAVIAIGYIFALLLRCSPIKASFDFDPPLFRPPYSFHCADREKVLYTGSLVTSILDFWVTLLPAPIAWKLDLPFKARVGVMGMFLLGLLICICGALKTRYIYTLGYTYDEPWVASPIWILSAVELDVGIMCSCAPTLRLVVRAFREKIRTSSHERNQWTESTHSLAHLKPQRSHISTSCVEDVSEYSLGSLYNV